METNGSFDAASELASIDDATAGYAKPLAGESVYHLSLGIALGLVVVTQGLSSPWTWILPPAALLIIVFLVGWWRRSHGWWVSGYVSGPTRWVVAAMAVVFFSLGLLSFMVDSVWVSVAAGVVVAAVTAALSFVWMIIWRRGLSAGETHGRP